jgi:hypothetical protein
VAGSGTNFDLNVTDLKPLTGLHAVVTERDLGFLGPIELGSGQRPQIQPSGDEVRVDVRVDGRHDLAAALFGGLYVLTHTTIGIDRKQLTGRYLDQI